MPQPLFSAIKHLWHYGVHRSMAIPLSLLLGSITLLISPVGDFPLNDDWVYAKTVQHLLQTGQYQSHPYLNATLVLQTYWGALFCKLFGFSFTTLRGSTLVLSGLNAWGVARCGLVLGLPRALALLCGTMVLTHPLMLGLSYSFMTDIPFLTLSTLSGLCFLKALRRSVTSLIAWGSILGVAAFFVRQFGVLVPMAFALTLGMLQWRGLWAVRWVQWLALAIPWGLATLAYIGLSRVIQSDTPILEAIGDRRWVTLLESIRYLPVSLTYLGCFILPLGMGLFWQLWRQTRVWQPHQWRLWIGFCSVSLLTFALPQMLFWLNQALAHKHSPWLQYFPYRMPFLPAGILLNVGIGNDGAPHESAYPVIDCAPGWWAVTLLALGMGGLTVVSACDHYQHWRRGGREPSQISVERSAQHWFLWLWVLLVLLALFNPWRVVMTDRYYLAAYVPLTLILASELRQVYRHQVLQWSALWAGLVLLVGLVLLQDYMAWNRAAAIAQHRLMTDYRVPAAAIASVDQLNGWYNSEAYMQRYTTRSWWDLNVGGKGPWVLDNQYILTSAAQQTGYEILERIPYFSWAGWKNQTLFILKRTKP